MRAEGGAAPLRIFSPRTVRGRFTVSALLVVTVFMTLAGVFRAFSSFEQGKNDLALKAVILSKLASEGLSLPIWNLDKEGIAAICDSLFQDDEVASVEVVDDRKRPLYERKRASEPFDAFDILLREERIFHDSQFLGTVTIGITTYYRDASLRRDIVVDLSSLFVTAFFIGLAMALVARMTTKSIDLLRAGTEELAARNWGKRLGMRGDDEIGALAAKFDLMAGSIQGLMKDWENAMAALAASEDKYAKAFRQSADVVGITRLADGRYLEINDAFLRIFGYQREEIIGHTSDEFGLWVDAEERAKLYGDLKSGMCVQNLETRWLTKAGDIRFGLSSSEVVDIGSEQCDLFVWHDITERKEAEDALREAHDGLERTVEERTAELSRVNARLGSSYAELLSTNRRLEEEIEERRQVQEDLSRTNAQLAGTLDELKKTQDVLVQSEKMAALGNLVAGVAHEINTPVGVGVTAASHLQGALQRFGSRARQDGLTRESLEDFLEDSDESIHILLNNLETAARLVRSFKEVSVDQVSEAPRSIGVREYLDEIVLNLRPKLKKTRIAVEVDCPDTLTFYTYPGALSQIVAILVVNSLMHAYEPTDSGKIAIRVSEEDGCLNFVYSDDGKGMGAEVLARIFEPFFTTKRGSGGTGLGLPVLYNLVTRKLGGSVRCTSEPGKGADFIFRLPPGERRSAGHEQIG